MEIQGDFSPVESLPETWEVNMGVNSINLTRLFFSYSNLMQVASVLK